MGSAKPQDRKNPNRPLDRRIIFLSLSLGLLPALVSPALADGPRAGGDQGQQGRTASAIQGGSEHSGPQVSAQSHHGAPPSARPDGRHGGQNPGMSHEGRYRPSSRPGHHPGVRPGWSGNLGWGWGGYYPGWYGWYGWYGYPYYGPGVVVVPGGSQVHGARAGALDLDVSPERASVYLDGRFVGVCDDFDGFPDYLWIEPGTHDLAIYEPGFVTIARQITVEAGELIQVDDQMEPGDAVKPEDLASKSTVRREERLRRDRERLEENAVRPPSAEPSSDGRGALDLRGEPGRLQLGVVPEDASVYLDGRFLGTGEELARLHSGLLVDPGQHRLEIVRPGYRSVERSFEATAGAEVELEIELEAIN